MRENHMSGSVQGVPGNRHSYCDIVALLCHTTHCNLPGILRGAGKMTYALPAPQACFGLFSGMFTALPYVIAR